jgi:hypothetical protein
VQQPQLEDGSWVSVHVKRYHTQSTESVSGQAPKDGKGTLDTKGFAPQLWEGVIGDGDLPVRHISIDVLIH